ncbi:hypothetical protein OBBRIDRAFT_742402, partial [Obba rivulosa]
MHERAGLEGTRPPAVLTTGARGRTTTHARAVPQTAQETPAPTRLGRASTSRPRGARQPIAPPETGRAETAREFAKRIRRVVLHGPRAERQEGERTVDVLPESHGEQLGARRRDEIMDAPGLTAREHADGAQQRQADTSEATIADVAPPHAAMDDRVLELLASDALPDSVSAALRGNYSEDPFFREILAKPRHYKNFVEKEGLIYLRDKQRELLCIPNILWDGRSMREVVISHAHTLLAHLGAYKTLSLLRDHVWWKT